LELGGFPPGFYCVKTMQNLKKNNLKGVAINIKSRGFTILELMMVVAILAAVSGAIIFSQGETLDDTNQRLAIVEMQAIKNALLRFKADTGALPVAANPADFSALYEKPSDETDWNINTARGWRGPYLTRKGEGLVDIGDDLKKTGEGKPTIITTEAKGKVRSVADPFINWPVKNGSDTPCTSANADDDCLLDWRTQSTDPRHTRWGRPYLLFDLDDSEKARLMSMGQNGRYESASCAGIDCASCSPSGDDILLCLTR